MSTARLRPYLAVGLVAFCWLYVFPYHRQLNNPNENSRVYQTMALVDYRTTSINNVMARYGWVNDLAKREVTNPDGTKEVRHYAGKAPGTSFLGIPAYYLARKIYAATAHRMPTKAEAIYWLRLGAVVIPSIVFLWFLRRHLVRRVPEDVADQAVIAYGLATMATPYTMMFASHHHTAIASFSAFLCAREGILRDHTGQPWTRVALPLAGAGAFAAFAAVCEYPLMIVVLVMGFYVLGALKNRLRSWAYIAGGIPVGGLLAFYHWRAFGRPLTTAYSFLANPDFVKVVAPGFYGMVHPTPTSVAGTLFEPDYGLFVFSPYLLIGFLALIAFARGRSRAEGAAPDAAPAFSRADAWCAIGVFSCMLFFNASMTIWRAGWCVGPRYISAVVPFLLVAAAVWLHLRTPRAVAPARRDLLIGGAGGLVIMGILLSGLSGLAYPHYPVIFENPVFEVLLPLFRKGYFPHHAGELFGQPGWVGIFPLILALLASIWVAVGASWRRLAIGLGVALVLIVPYSRIGRQPTPRKTSAYDFVQRTWEPQPLPPGLASSPGRR